MFNTGRTVIIEKSEKSGANIECADSGQVLQKMQHRDRVRLIRNVPRKRTEKEFGCMADIQMQKMLHNMESYSDVACSTGSDFTGNTQWIPRK